MCVCRNGSQEGRGARAVACSVHAEEEEQVEEDHRWRRESGTEPGGGPGPSPPHLGAGLERGAQAPVTEEPCISMPGPAWGFAPKLRGLGRLL